MFLVKVVSLSGYNNFLFIFRYTHKIKEPEFLKKSTVLLLFSLYASFENTGIFG